MTKEIAEDITTDSITYSYQQYKELETDRDRLREQYKDLRRAAESDQKHFEEKIEALLQELDDTKDKYEKLCVSLIEQQHKI